MSAPGAHNLVGKIVAVQYGSGQKDHEYIEATGFELQDGRYFLVGKTISGFGLSTYAPGIRFCVAWDVVTAYYEFDSIEECSRAVAT
jgi:hypothetical protein